MTHDEALALIRGSSAWKAAGGDAGGAYRRWAASNPREAAAWAAYATSLSSPPAFETAFGRGLVGLLDGLTPSPAPPVHLERFAIGALVVNAQAAWDKENATSSLRRAGVTMVGPQIHSGAGHDATTTANLDVLGGGFGRWLRERGFTVGGWGLSLGKDVVAEASVAASVIAEHGLSWYCADTEAHKIDMGGRREWTETLFAELRRRLGRDFPLYNVTFGRHSSPGVVNHDALRRHGVTAIWEAYDAAGETDDPRFCAHKAIGEGWTRPHVALGDKSLARDAPVVAQLVREGKLGACWIWAAEQAGPDVEALQGILA